VGGQRKRALWAVLAVAGFWAAAEPVDAGREVVGMSLEELMGVQVTTVSRRAEALSDAPAAVYVITAEDIRRAGVTTVPDALRLVPGVQVARVDANKWAVTARGFNGRFSNKLLVLVDGRTVYTPLFSGVHWDTQDLVLEDIDRIEVIRGPGATLWGANAVNGVINILTRHAKDTQGLLVSMGGGDEERGFLTVRYGTAWGQDRFARAWVRAFGRDAAVDRAGKTGYDAWQGVRSGWRMDGGTPGASTWTFQGEGYAEHVQSRTRALLAPGEPMATFDEEDLVRGVYALGRWRTWFGPASDFTVQAYYDRTDRSSRVLGEVREAWDLDLQHRFTVAGRHEIVWGGGARLTRDRLDDSFAAEAPRNRRTDRLWSGFVQDEVELVRNRLRLTVGTKVERNDYTGTEIQPNARILWVLTPRHRIWAAVSRAVRTPSRVEPEFRVRTAILPPSPAQPIPVEVDLLGTSNFDSEKLTAYELGYRTALTPELTADLALFYHVYRDLRTMEPAGSPSPSNGVLVQEMILDNRMRGISYGAELDSGWRPAPWWNLRLAYTWTVLRLTADESLDPTAEAAEGEVPRSQVSLRSSWDLGEDWELDLWVRHTGSLPSLGVDPYTTLDLRVGWRPVPGLEVSVVGQNLLESHHPEFTPSILSTTVGEVERSVFARVIWRR